MFRLRRSAAPITCVIVRDVDFAVIQTLSDANELGHFREHWSSKQQRPPRPAAPAAIKLDVFQGETCTRYLYDPAGFVRVLTKASTPEFEIQCKDAFNALIGVARQAPDPVR